MIWLIFTDQVLFVRAMQGDRQGDPTAAQKFVLVVTQISEDTDTLLEDRYLVRAEPFLNHQIDISGVAFAYDMARVGISSTPKGLWTFAGWEVVMDKGLGDESLATNNSKLQIIVDRGGSCVAVRIQSLKELLGRMGAAVKYDWRRGQCSRAFTSA